MASIYQRGKTWWVTYYQNGQKFSKSLKTREKKIAEFQKRDLENKVATLKSPLPFDQETPQNILKEYLEFCRKKNREKTVTDDERRIDDYLQWAKLARIRDLTDKNVLEYLGERLKNSEKPIQKGTANRILAAIKAYCSFAVRRGYLGQNPLRHTSQLPVDKKAPRWLNKKELNGSKKDNMKGFLKAAQEEIIFPMVMTALYAGMRYEELRSLKGHAVSYQSNHITVHKSKSKKFRNIPINKELKKVMKPLVVGSDEKYFPYQNIRRIFKRICRNSAIPDWQEIGWHTLRHTFAAHFLMSGGSLFELKEILGHADIKTTLIYSHLANEHLDNSVQRLHF